MTDFRYGPVELTLVTFDGGIDSSTFEAFGELCDSKVVRLVDLVIVSKSASGKVTVTEVDGNGLGVQLDLPAAGIIGDDDTAEFAELISPGSSAALVAVELSYQRSLASRLAESGGVVLSRELIPAPVVNALVDHIESQGE